MLRVCARHPPLDPAEVTSALTFARRALLRADSALETAVSARASASASSALLPAHDAVGAAQAALADSAYAATAAAVTATRLAVAAAEDAAASPPFPQRTASVTVASAIAITNSGRAAASAAACHTAAEHAAAAAARNPARCLACGLPPERCPGPHPLRRCQCTVCRRPLATGLVGYPGLEASQADPAETWTPPGREPLTDGDGHPLTWAVVHHAHATLVRHASCGGALSRWGPTTDAGRDVNTGYDSSDGRPCPCRWHETLSDELGMHRDTCAAWPGPICGTCWAASCPCGYVFENAADAAGRDSLGRLVCAAPTCRQRIA